MRIVALSLVAAVASAVACSSSSEPEVGGIGSASNGSGDAGASSSSSTSGDAAAKPAATDAASTAPPAAGDGGADGGNCVPPGYGGNEKKIGAYCDDQTACPFQVDPFLICTAGHDPTNTHLFCTTPCSKDEECGTNAFCVHYSSGSGCVPAQCGGAPGSH